MDTTSKIVKVYIKSDPSLGPYAEIQNGTKATGLIGVLNEQELTPNGLERAIKRITELKQFKELMEELGGFYFEDNWHEVKVLAPPGSWCTGCGNSDGYYTPPVKQLTVHNGKPYCTSCLLSLKKIQEGANARP